MGPIRRSIRGQAFTLILAVLLAGCSLWDPDDDPPAGAPPVNPPGGFAVDVSGGQGTGGRGGDADSESGIYVENYGPLGLRIERDGGADASFTLTLPAATPDLGGEPLIVGADLSIPVHPDTPPDNGVYYFLAGDPTLYHKVDDATINPVTGIRVEAGVTLTLGLNADHNGDGRFDAASVRLANDLEVYGTVRTSAFADAATQDSGYALDRGGLRVDTDGAVFIRSSGLVATAGDDASSGAGGHGGALAIETRSGSTPNGGLFLNEGRIDASGGSTADPDAPGGNAALYGGSGNPVSIRADGEIYNTGAIRAVGGTGGTDGGSGPAGWPGVRLNASSSVHNTGPLAFDGGAGSGGNGGNGGAVEIEATDGSLRNSGSVTAKGGPGRVSGGQGGSIRLYNNSAGNVLNAGDIDAGGGDGTGTDDLAAAYGGYAGDISIYCYGGDLVSSGDLSAGGGDAMSANASSQGGNANGITIESYASSGEGMSPAGRMEISGSLRARGGRGASGGYGGWVYVYYGDSGGAGGAVLLGYADIAANGGPGTDGGGYGGAVWLYDYSSGGLAADAAVAVSGGSGASGGDGGYVDTYSSAAVSHGGAVAANGGDASSSVGNYAGNGGSVSLWSDAPPSTYTSISVRPGTGGDPGGPPSVGWISLDGTDVTPADGTLP